MGPWFWRNLQDFGSLSAPGNLRGLWLLEYNELYVYPSSILTWQRWWQAGLGELLAVRWRALGSNLGTLLLVQGEIFLLPLAVLGLWRSRRGVCPPGSFILGSCIPGDDPGVSLCGRQGRVFSLSRCYPALALDGCAAGFG